MESEWISVKDRKPELKVPVLAWIVGYGSKPEIILAKLIWHHGYWMHIGGYGTMDEFITHWRPLPPPPKQ